MTVSWNETSRKIVARPFKLVTESGETIQVEPGESVMVADGLETVFSGASIMDRVCRCDVKRGEVFTAYGALHGSPAGSTRYRGSGNPGWILKPYRTTVRWMG